MYHSFHFCPLISNSISSKLLTNSSSSIAAAPPTTLAESVSIPCSVRGWGSIVLINHCASGWVSSYCCSSSTRSSKMINLLFDPCSFLTAILLSLPVTPSAKNSRDTDCVVNLCNRSPQEGSMSPHSVNSSSHFSTFL